MKQWLESQIRENRLELLRTIRRKNSAYRRQDLDAEKEHESRETFLRGLGTGYESALEALEEGER